MPTNGRIPTRQIDATGTRDATTALHGDGTWKASTATPSGAAGGSLAGTYPNPSLAAGAVNSAEINAAIKDAAAATASLRTLGTGALQAAAGNDARLSDARTPLAHTHLIADLPTDVIVPAALGTAAAGTASTLARRDHVHAMPTAADVGAAAAGHTHTLSYGTATELADVDAAAEAAGTSTAVARADHKHGVATAAPVALTGSTQAAGASTSLARADHQHGIPTGIPQANVTNLTTDLAGKAATSHTHTKANITDFAHTHPATDITTGLTIAQTTGLQAALDGKADDAELAAHLADTTDAHDASAISVVPTGTIAASDVQAALAELGTEKEPTLAAASESAPGKVELATAAETATGTDNTRAVHPAGLKPLLDAKAATIVGASVWRSTTLSLPNDTGVLVPFDTEQFDDGFWDSGSPTRLTVPAGMGGRYEAAGGIRFAINATGIRYCSIFKNASTVLSSIAFRPQDAPYNTDTFTLAAPTVLAAGDYITLEAYQTSGGTLSTAVSTGAVLTWLSLTKVG